MMARGWLEVLLSRSPGPAVFARSDRPLARSRQPRLARSALVLVGLCAACGAGGEREPPTLAIGSSESEFVALAEGAPIRLYRGPQGGYHVFLAVRATNVAPGSAGEAPRPCASPGTSPCVDLEVRDESGAVRDAYAGLRLPLTPSAAGFDLLPPRLVQLDTSSFDELDGQRLHITATLDDRDGVHLTHSVTAICTPFR
jgi:hypothetical protein